MHIVHVNVVVKPDGVDAFIEATLANARASVQEPGCARFDVLQDQADPARFRLVEVYRDEAAVASHKETPHYAAWAEAVGALMAEPRTKGVYRNVFPDEHGWG
jgi:(4S)-4-hydroxy-5-phosphonooxypentane-2,3-dione isomerase